MPQTNMATQENQVFDCLCGCDPCPKPGASGDQQSSMAFSTITQASRRSDASMKVITSFMLNAWRQRREEVRELQHVVEGLETSVNRTKNELHVLNTVMRVEQKRNSELQLQLRESHMSINKVRTSCENLTSSIQSLTAEKNELQTNLEKSKKELSELEEISGQTKKELFGAISEQRNLESQLSEEQRSRHQLQLENEELQKKFELTDFAKSKYQKAQESHQQELAEKDESIQSLRKALEEKDRNEKEQTAELEKIKAQITELCQKNSKSNFLSYCSASISRLNLSPRINQELSFIQRSLLWQKFQQFSCNLMHLFSVFLRPGTYTLPRRWL